MNIVIFFHRQSTRLKHTTYVVCLILFASHLSANYMYVYLKLSVFVRTYDLSVTGRVLYVNYGLLSQVLRVILMIIT